MKPIEVEELTQALFEEAGDALFLFDTESEQVLDANPMAQRLTGFPRRELLQMQCSYLFRSEVPGGLNRLRQAYRKTGVFHSQEGFILRTQRDGVWIPVNLTVTRLHIQPRTLGLITARDVREQREAHAQLKKVEAELRRVLASISDCLYTAEVDAQGRWTYPLVSPVIERLTGQTPDFFRPGPHRWRNVVHPDDVPRWEEAQRLLRLGQSVQEEYRIVRPDESVCWVRDSVMASRTPDGQGLKLDGVLTDITEQKRSEEALRTSEERFRTLVEQSADVIFLLGSDRILTYASSSLTPVMGYTTDELLGADAFTLLHPDDLPGIEQLFQVCLSGPNQEVRAECRMRHKDGTWRTIEGCGVNRLDDPSIGAVVATFRDVTVRKRAEERIRFQASILAQVSDGVLVIDGQQRIDYWNRGAERLFGFGAGEAMGRTTEEVLHWSWPRPGEESGAWQSLAATGVWRGEGLARRKDGATLFVESAVSPLKDAQGRGAGLLVLFHDITERRRAEAALRESNERLRALIQASPLAILALDATGQVRSWNAAAARMFGWSEAEVLGKPSPLTPPGHEGEQLTLRHRVLRGESFAGVESQRWRKDGSTIEVSISAAPLHDTLGRVSGVMAVLADITDRKAAEQALARERAILRGLIDSIPDLIFTKDCQGTFLGCNAAFEQFLGRPEKELIGLTDADLFGREEAQSFQDLDRALLADGKPRRLEEWLRFPDGHRVLFESLKTPFFGADGRVLGLIGISRDITERKRLEEQLQQSQKLEAIGQLAGGVAHDFNNLLTAILGNLALLSASVPAGPNREMLQASESAAQRAADLTRQLLGFSRQAMLRLEVTDVNAAIREVLGILRRTIDPRIAVELRPAASLWSVRADPGQLNQVLMNLCLNARDAMPDGGTLTLETANVVLDERQAQLYLEARMGEFVRLRVSDTGHGIEPDVRSRIFEPFFTTKGPGKGTGLGLAMVFGIVKQHQGWVECVSDVGRGTRFDIYLPRHRDGTPVPKPAAAEPSPAGGSETVLLVDDEAMIRNLGRAILQRYGYRVLLAEDGIEALETYRRENGRVDLVILDLTMPRLSGRDTLRELRLIDSKVRVLFASGYSAEQVTEEERSAVAGFISKPYRPQELANTVRALLNKS